MKRSVNRGLLSIMAMGFFASCSDLGKKVEDRLIDLDTKAEQLDSLINREVDRVMQLDTLIGPENARVKKLDSIIERNSSKIDSIARKKIQLLKEIVN